MDSESSTIGIELIAGALGNARSHLAKLGRSIVLLDAANFQTFLPLDARRQMYIALQLLHAEASRLQAEAMRTIETLEQRAAVAAIASEG